MKVKEYKKQTDGNYLVYFEDADMVAHITDEKEIKELDKQLKPKKKLKTKKK